LSADRLGLQIGTALYQRSPFSTPCLKNVACLIFYNLEKKTWTDSFSFWNTTSW